MKIGICDWGIGGLGFYQALRSDRPDIDVIYLGDQGFTPYGRASTLELANRVRIVQQWFLSQGVSELVVACNAASTVLDGVHVDGITSTGVIKPTLQVLLKETSTVSVIGGRRTIRSGAYRRPLVSSGITVQQRVAQPLSGLIESGKGNDPETIALLRRILWPVRHSSRLVLACTHYVVLESAAREIMPHAQLVDPATEVWKQMLHRIPEIQGEGTSGFFTTGDPLSMEIQAYNAFGVRARVQPWS